MAKAKHRRARTRRRGVLYRPLCVLLVIAAILFSLGVFFRTLHIEVQGNAYYTAGEIISAGGVRTGRNLFLISKKDTRADILAALPYVREVTIDRRLPGTLEITVTESKPLAYIVSGGSCWLLDSDCKVLEADAQHKTEQLIQIKGLEPTELIVGKKITVAEEDRMRKEFLTAVLHILSEKEMNGSIRQMDVSNSSNLVFDYDQRFTVKLGQNEELESKMELLRVIAEQKGPNDRGTIDLSYGKEGHFIPEA